MTSPGASPVQGQWDRDALVTGASGFIGGRLVTRLVANGATVTCTTRGTGSPVLDAPVRWCACDLTDAGSVQDAFSRVRPEVVFHLAGQVSGLREPENVPATLAGNLVATVNVLLASLECGVRRVVVAGSYEEPDGDAAPRSPYAASKAGGTAYARMFARLYGLSTVVLRPAMVYGPGQRDQSKLIPYAVRSFLAGEAPVLSSGRRAVDWVYVDDVTEAFVTAAAATGIDGEVIDIGSGELHTISDIVELLAKETGASRPAQFGGLPDRPAEFVGAANTEKARRMLAWTASTPLDEGLARTVESIRSAVAAEGSA